MELLTLREENKLARTLRHLQTPQIITVASWSKTWRVAMLENVVNTIVATEIKCHSHLGERSSISLQYEHFLGRAKELTAPARSLDQSSPRGSCRHGVGGARRDARRRGPGARL